MPQYVGYGKKEGGKKKSSSSLPKEKPGKVTQPAKKPKKK